MLDYQHQWESSNHRFNRHRRPSKYWILNAIRKLNDLRIWHSFTWNRVDQIQCPETKKRCGETVAFKYCCSSNRKRAYFVLARVWINKKCNIYISNKPRTVLGLYNYVSSRKALFISTVGASQLNQNLIRLLKNGSMKAYNIFRDDLSKSVKSNNFIASDRDKYICHKHTRGIENISKYYIRSRKRLPNGQHSILPRLSNLTQSRYHTSELANFRPAPLVIHIGLSGLRSLYVQCIFSYLYITRGGDLKTYSRTP